MRPLDPRPDSRARGSFHGRPVGVQTSVSRDPWLGPGHSRSDRTPAWQAHAPRCNPGKLVSDAGGRWWDAARAAGHEQAGRSRGREAGHRNSSSPARVSFGYGRRAIAQMDLARAEQPATGSSVSAGSNEQPPQEPAEPAGPLSPLKISEPSQPARLGVAVQQPPPVRLSILGFLRVSVAVRHSTLRAADGLAAPARLAAWCIRRAPHPGDRPPPGIGRQRVPNQRPTSPVAARQYPS
jgi:hypothetical protein